MSERNESIEWWWNEPFEATIRDAKTGETRQVAPTREALWTLLDGMTEAERSSVRVIHDWRDEYGDYIHDLLSWDRPEGA